MEIKFNNFSGKYKKSSVTVLKDISFTINSGDMIAIIGKSGSGKTSLFNAILKQLYIAQGEIIINNYSLDNIKKREWKKIIKKVGFLSQDTFLLEDENVFQSILRTYTKYKNFFFELFKIITKEQKIEIFEILDKLGIFDKSFSVISSLSGGQKQRVEIAKILLKDVDLILADEPTSNLDVKTSNDVIQLLKNINEEKKITILVNVHNIELAKKYFNKYVAIKDGQIIKYGKFDALTEKDINFIYDIDK